MRMLSTPAELESAPAVHWRRHPRTIAIRGWAAAVFVYVMAVFQRSSLGVAGLQAEHRFGISAAALSVFVLLQLGVYAAMQIPTGILVDRFGPRRLLVTAALLTGGSQILFAVAPSFGMAILARGVLGCGDALTFVSVLRFASVHFAPRRYPAIVAVTAVVGTIGSIAATVPLSDALAQLGWAVSFAGAGTLSLIAGAVVWLVLPATERGPRQDMTWAQMRVKSVRVGRRVGQSWTRPGTRLGFWLHFATMSTPTAFAVLWGFPYLVSGLGFTRTQASGLLLLNVVVALIANMAVGVVVGIRPAIRVPVALGVCALTIVGWAIVLSITPSSVPTPFMVGLILVMALGGPVSAVAFALARDYNDTSSVGTASGMVNIGGWVATIVISALIGLILGAFGTSPQSYRLAMAVMVLVQVGGTVQLVRWWLATRAQSLRRQTRGETVPVPVVRHSWDLATAE
jgi:MFS family permease